MIQRREEGSRGVNNSLILIHVPRSDRGLSALNVLNVMADDDFTSPQVIRSTIELLSAK